ncbi:uncharacterized protein LOC124958836 [Sciurus carolinensis]|uniref:uncharacterized protein LOC124958836 n=1 Tax=Sciurus carolinensis TaxID=30640 RepID=UPI001FB4729D|nr:uncharacterized protein LOC124958836 [Sciurus carolinensis]
MPARRPGRGAAISWEDMTWSGVTARTEGLPTGLPEHSGWPGGGGCPRRVVPLVSDGVNTPLLLSGPLEPQDVKKWCCPAQVWAFNSGTSSSPSSSGSRLCCIREPLHTDSGIGSAGEAEGTGLERAEQPAAPAARRHLRDPPCAQRTITAASPSFLLPPFLLSRHFSSFFLPLLERFKASVTLFPHLSPLNSICTKSFALVWSSESLESLCECA